MLAIARMQIISALQHLETLFPDYQMGNFLSAFHIITAGS
jgi:hypothetical protein